MKPEHYKTKSGMDAFDVAEDWRMTDLRQFSALKYILRAHRKGQQESDIAKAIECLEGMRAKKDNNYVATLEDGTEIPITR